MTGLHPFEMLGHSTLLIGNTGRESEMIAESLGRCGTTAIVGEALERLSILAADALSSYDTVVVSARRSSTTLDTKTVDGLLRYVEGGGVLVTTPFFAEAIARSQNQACDALLPVVFVAVANDGLKSWQVHRCASYGAVANVNVRVQLSVTAGGEIVELRPEATLFASETDTRRPAVASRVMGQGRIFYINATSDTLAHAGTDQSSAGSVFDVFANLVNGHDLWQLGIRSSCHEKFFDPTRDRYIGAVSTDERISLKKRTSPADRLAMFGGSKALMMAHETNGLDSLGDIPEWQSRYQAFLAEVMTLSPHLSMTDGEFSALPLPERLFTCRKLVSYLENPLFEGVPVAGTDLDGKSFDVHSWNECFFQRLGRLFFLLEPGISTLRQNIDYDHEEIRLLLNNCSETEWWNQLGSPLAISCQNWNADRTHVDCEAIESWVTQSGAAAAFLMFRSPLKKEAVESLSALAKKAIRRGIRISVLSLQDIRKSLFYANPNEILKTLHQKLVDEDAV